MAADRRPVVLCLSGIDPTGAAGLHAEIEVLHGMQVHVVSLATALTVQDTTNVSQIMPVPMSTLAAQWACLQQDGIRPDAVKVGLVPSAAHAQWIAERLTTLSCPVVIDPVLRAGGGRPMAAAAWLTPLLATATVITPNHAEALTLLGRAVEGCTLARELRVHVGCGAVVVTGGDTHPDAAQVDHAFADGDGAFTLQHPRVAGRFRGAGCTFAAALTGGMACGQSPRDALPHALERTRGALVRGWPLGQGRWLPGR
jgi:hydroxymethylpyrimidine/phosphomethylpyrimidine kinase